MGGHCIGVDPYYLAQKAQELGYHPEVILAGRRMNDSMGQYVAGELVKCMVKKGVNVLGSRVLVLGITFKEDCPDVRNTKVVDVIHGLQEYGIDVCCYDPWANPSEVAHEYSLHSVQQLGASELFDAVVLAVAHKEFRTLDVKSKVKANGVIYDVKGFLPSEIVDARL